MAAPVWKRIFKGSAWLLGIAFALPIVLYIALLLINWRDQPPSEAALRLEREYRNRPAVADADNAYVYAMGSEVAPDADPREAGLRRIEWVRTLPPEALYPVKGDPVTLYDTYRSSRSPRVQKISEACRTKFVDCSEALEGSDDELRTWIESEQWLLERYSILLRHPGWRESVPFDGRVALPNYATLLEGQKLLLAKAYLLAGQGDAIALRELLGNDVRFWRRVLASSDILVTKMIAVSALSRTFGMGNLALRRLPAGLQLAAMPGEWTIPLSDGERSMHRCLTGEWVAAGLMLDRSMPPTGMAWFGDGDPQSEIGFFDAAVNRAFRPMFRPQDMKNRQAEMFLRMSAALDVPIERFSDGLDQARQNSGVSTNPIANLYNPIGRILLWISAGSYAAYPPRIADVEGVRRAAVLTTELRAHQVLQQNISTELSASEMRTPYTDEAFTWSAEEQAIVFVGLQPGERGRHAFKY